MSFEILIKKSVKKFIFSLDQKIRNKIINLIEILASNPLPFRYFDLVKLKGYRNFYRIRIGKIRIIYEVDFDKRRIIVWGIKYRGKAYK